MQQLSLALTANSFVFWCFLRISKLLAVTIIEAKIIWALVLSWREAGKAV